MIEAARFKSVYLVPRDHPWSHGLRERLDSIAGRQLQAALSCAMSKLAGARPDQSIWILRRLEYAADLAADSNDDELAGRWADQLVSALVARIDSGSSGDAVHFSDAADLLRSYLIDAAAGREDKWFYKRFAGLQLLSVTARLRTAVCGNAAVGLEALARMSGRELRQVIGALSEIDARRIWETFGSHIPSSTIAMSLPVAHEVWSKEGRLMPDGAGEFRWALHMAVAALRGTSPDARIWLGAARALGRLLWLLGRISRTAVGSVLDAIESEQRLELERVFGVQDAIAIEELLGCKRGFIEKFLDDAPLRSAEAPERRYTPWGGVFLLLPFIDALPVPCSIAHPNLVRFWILLKCLGGARAMRVFEDPVVRALFDIDKNLSAEVFRRWQSELPIRRLRIFRRLCRTSPLVRDNSRHHTPGDRDHLRLPRMLASRRRDAWIEEPALLVMRSLAWRLPGFSLSGLAHLYANVLDFRASVEEHPDRRVVRLGAPPLQLLLNITGICRWHYTLSWLGGKRWELYPEAP